MSHTNVANNRLYDFSAETANIDGKIRFDSRTIALNEAQSSPRSVQSGQR